MFDFWYELPPAFRAVMGLVMMAAAVVIFFATGGTFIVYGLFIVGLILLLFCTAGHGKGGYKF